MLLALLASSVVLPSRAETGPAFSASPERSSDGVFQLEWTHPGRVRIEQALRSDFGDAVVVYEGADRATTVTGRVDGLYHYRLIALDPLDASVEAGARRATSLQVEVSHHPLSRALAFFALGLLVFASTVVLVVQGDRRASTRTAAHHG